MEYKSVQGHVSDRSLSYLLTKIPARPTDALCSLGEGGVTRVLFFLPTMHSGCPQLQQSCRDLLHSADSSLEDERQRSEELLQKRSEMNISGLQMTVPPALEERREPESERWAAPTAAAAPAAARAGCEASADVVLVPHRPDGRVQHRKPEKMTRKK